MNWKELLPMRFNLLLLIVLLIDNSLFAADATSSAAKLNVLIIQTDEHNFRTLGCYRNKLPQDQAFIWGDGVQVETPHIDWLAQNGAICTRYYATSPVCTPSRASLMTGLYPQNTGSIKNDLPMLDDRETFAQVLLRSGYANGYAGKWHLDGDARPGWAPKRNFGFTDNRFMFNRGHWKKLAMDTNGPLVPTVDKKGIPNYALDDADENSFTTDFLTNRAIEFIRHERDRPFCFMLSLPDPHGPNVVRAPYDTMFDASKFQQPRTALTKGEKLPAFAAVTPDRFSGQQMALYFGMVKCIDDNVGRLIAALRENGLIEQTMIVFTSDHGDMCGEHGRYNKGIPCEGSARIPFLIYAAGLVAPGTTVQQALGTVDFKPTLLGLLGLETASPMQGRNAAQLLRTGRSPDDWVDQIFVRIGESKGNSATGWVATFTQRFKLIYSPIDEPGLFDLEEDPFEMKNLFYEPSQRSRIRQMSQELRTYLVAADDPHQNSPAVMADVIWAVSMEPSYNAPLRQKRGKAANDSKE